MDRSVIRSDALGSMTLGELYTAYEELGDDLAAARYTRDGMEITRLMVDIVLVGNAIDESLDRMLGGTTGLASTEEMPF